MTTKKLPTDLPAFGGLTLKDVGEVAKMTMTRDEAVSQRGVNETRRGYKNLKGIQQVDTNMQYYVCPSYLQEWLDTNKGFFLKPLHPSLVPRGILGDGPPGCLSGDTVLHYRRGKRNSSRPITLQSLYRKFNGLPDEKNPPRIDAPTFLQSMQEDGSVKYNRIISIIESGEKVCIRITTSSGSALSLTKDHPVCLSDGTFIPAGNIQKGTVLRMKGSGLARGTGGRKPRTIHRREICVKHHPFGNFKVVEGCTYKRMHFSRIMVEAHMNKMNLATYLKRLKFGNLEGLKFLSPDHEVHHRDENQRNDRLDNLEVMTKVAHAQHHGKSENFNVEYVVSEVVILVEDAGIRMTYDVQMDSPARNLVADSFIVLDACSGLCSD
ncbi:MAG: HNH endonuclease [Sulfuritalea sp.]|nr:HNH endonuclease [Sulfuritalea sp.]